MLFNLHDNKDMQFVNAIISYSKSSPDRLVIYVLSHHKNSRQTLQDWALLQGEDYDAVHGNENLLRVVEQV